MWSERADDAFRFSFLTSSFCTGFSLQASAQEPQATEQQEFHSEYIPVFQYWKEHNIFQHLDLSVTAGTTGIGIEASSPIGEYFQLRAGYDYMPRFTAKMKFDVTIGGQPAHQYDAQGNPVESSFDKMQKLMKGFSGYDVEDHVDMVGKPTMNNSIYFPLRITSTGTLLQVSIGDHHNLLRLTIPQRR